MGRPPPQMEAPESSQAAALRGGGAPSRGRGGSREPATGGHMVRGTRRVCFPGLCGRGTQAEQSRAQQGLTDEDPASGGPGFRDRASVHQAADDWPSRMRSWPVL